MKSHEELTYASPADIGFYIGATIGLPERPQGSHLPYGSEAHIVKHFRRTIEIVKPYNILEIGLNLGWSSALWLELCPADVISVDVSNRPETIEAGEFLADKYDTRFQYLICDSAKSYLYLKNFRFDLMFVDGGHEEENVTADIILGLALQVKYFLFDDIYERYGPGVMKAIEKFLFYLRLEEDMDNLRLYKNLKYA